MHGATRATRIVQSLQRGVTALTFAELSALSAESFLERVGFVYEESPWVMQRAWERGPFADPAALLAAAAQILSESSHEARVALIASHPDLGGRVAREGRLTAASRQEQASAGLDDLSPREVARFNALNAAYRERFGFPFVICAREHTKESILAALETRLDNDLEAEIDTAIREIGKIAKLRLMDVVSD